ncbi:Non-specific serine/threonine protein kinase [Quillaja saponaria]|uniref:non-specific serine/threonine protein kinase n=1 Tax=Quillaja saponaria TaxID=32244 RepID=A0AAD7LWD3_QUISA|nr:Non-specific serine/threonine protein kinase [Quillaja saponaria]
MENNMNVLMHRYELGRLLGQGNFAKVYYGRSTTTNQSVAIKVIDKYKVQKVGLVDQIKREISVMRLVRHHNVLHLYEVLATKTKIYFVLEYAKGGELFNKVAQGKLKEDVARIYFQQLVNAVDYCHCRGVYHRDIKPENLLLDENKNLKVSDFGLSALAESKLQDGLLHTTCGTPAYVAPEVIDRKGYDGAKADIWSCGVVLFVMLSGYLPFDDSNLIEMYRKIGKAEFKCPYWFSPEVRRLLNKILDPDPNTRISIAKLKQSSWFKKGLNTIHTNTEVEEKTVSPSGTNDSDKSEKSGRISADMNAFDIITHSSGFDLSGLFKNNFQKKEARFTSKQPASVIISKLEEIAKSLRLKIRKIDRGLKLEGLKEGRKGILSIDSEIFEITPFFHLVEIKKSDGDTIEYQKILKEDMRPALKDIVWVWDGEKHQESQQLQEKLQQHHQL